jgi:hypothetical protein
MFLLLYSLDDLESSVALEAIYCQDKSLKESCLTLLKGQLRSWCFLRIDCQGESTIDRTYFCLNSF